MKIADIVLIEVAGEFPVEKNRPDERNIHPLDIYPEFAEKAYAEAPVSPAGTVREKALYLEIRTDEGVTGFFGPVDEPAAIVLLREIRAFVLGYDPLAIEKIWEVLLRWNRHSHSGYFMMAMSALDCALWDLKGKALGQPVHRLLGGLVRRSPACPEPSRRGEGGPARAQVPAYASMLGFSLQPEALAQRAQEYGALGYPAQKWFFRCGPSHGQEGISKNVELARTLRRALGEGGVFMLDAFHSWDMQYAVEVGRRVAPFSPAWLEEPVPSDQVGEMRTIRQLTGIPLATGEHIYNHWQVETLLEAGAADVIQCDPDWCGGISELLKIAQVCSAHKVPLYPHGHSLHAALHAAAALPESILPQVEFLIHHQRSKQRFMKDYLEPQNGLIRPPSAPGLGIELDPEKSQSRREIQ